MIGVEYGRLAGVASPFSVLDDLFHQHVTSVYHVAARVLWNRADAEDVVQATFLKAFTRLDQLENPSKSRSWLLTIAYREAVEVLRRRRENPTDPHRLPDEPDPLADPAAQVQRKALASRISDAIQSLPEVSRHAVILRDVEELPMAAVAAALGVSVSAAKMRVARGRETLRLNLIGELDDL